MKLPNEGIIIEVDPPVTKTAGGLDLAPESIKPSQTGTTAAVSEVWNNVEEVKVGDRILFALAAGQEARAFEWEGKSMLNLLPSEILAII